MDRLLDNAIESIRVGVEDYETQQEARSRSAVRNLHAGLLLLAKWVLVKSVPNAREDEVIATFYEPMPDDKGGVRYVPAGNQTIGLREIPGRFTRFDLPLSGKTKKRLESLAKVRNDIEHRYTGLAAVALRQTISKAFPVASEMFRLGRVDPVALLGNAWDVMLNVNEVYEQELEACQASFENVEWQFEVRQGSRVECPHCESELVEQVDPQNVTQHQASSRCRSCGWNVEAEAVVEHLVKSSFEWNDYVSVTETGEGVLFGCPSCTRESYVNEADDNGELTGCVVCGFRLEQCVRCGTDLRPDDLDCDSQILCSYCGYIMAKDD